MASFTVAYLMARTKNLLIGSTREEMNRLTSAVLNTDTTITFDFPLGAIAPGATLAVEDELMHVWSINSMSSGSTAVVQRGINGTTPAAHAAGVVCYVNQYFPQFEIRNTLRDEIRSWGPQVFQVKTVDVTSTNFVAGYDLGALGDWYSILDVRESPDTLVATPSDKNWATVAWDVQQSSNTADFPSGNALLIAEPGGVFDSPRTFHVTYAAAFDVDTAFTDTTDIIAAVGLDATDVDIPPYGAAWRLMAGHEVRRNLYEPMGSSADQQFMPPGSSMRAAEGFKQLRDSRLTDARQRLRAKYPYRRAR